MGNLLRASSVPIRHSCRAARGRIGLTARPRGGSDDQSFAKCEKMVRRNAAPKFPNSVELVLPLLFALHEDPASKNLASANCGGPGCWKAACCGKAGKAQESNDCAGCSKHKA